MFDFFKYIKKTDLEKPKTLGQLGEEFAQNYYKSLGFNILQANFFNKKGLRKGEVDFIARDKHKLVFVEVKTRRSRESKFGSGEESVNVFKQKKLLKAVKLYLLQNPKLAYLSPRIDVCIVLFNEFDKKFICDKIILNAVEDVC